MSQPTETRLGRQLRIPTAAALAVTALWQVYIVVVAFRMAPVLEGLLAGFGGELPAVTRSFLGSYRFFAVLPAATATAAIVTLRGGIRGHNTHLRPEMRIVSPYSPWQSAALVALALGATMALHAWANEAFFAPVLGILGSIG